MAAPQVRELSLWINSASNSARFGGGTRVRKTERQLHRRASPAKAGHGEPARSYATSFRMCSANASFVRPAGPAHVS